MVTVAATPSLQGSAGWIFAVSCSAILIILTALFGYSVLAPDAIKIEADQPLDVVSTSLWRMAAVGTGNTYTHLRLNDDGELMVAGTSGLLVTNLTGVATLTLQQQILESLAVVTQTTAELAGQPAGHTIQNTPRDDVARLPTTGPLHTSEWIVDVPTGATWNQTDGRVYLTAGSVANVSSTLATWDRFPLVGEFPLTVSVTMATNVLVEGCAAYVGWGDTDNGVFLGSDGVAPLGLLLRYKGVDTYTPQASFQNIQLLPVHASPQTYNLLFWASGSVQIWWRVPGTTDWRLLHNTTAAVAPLVAHRSNPLTATIVPGRTGLTNCTLALADLSLAVPGGLPTLLPVAVGPPQILANLSDTSDARNDTVILALGLPGTPASHRRRIAHVICNAFTYSARPIQASVYMGPVDLLVEPQWVTRADGTMALTQATTATEGGRLLFTTWFLPGETGGRTSLDTLFIVLQANEAIWVEVDTPVKSTVFASLSYF